MKASLIVCVIVFISVSIVEAHIVTDGLISYYTLDKADIEDKTVKDVFGDNDGTIISDPQSVEGHLGEGLDFGGGPDCVELPQIFAIGEGAVTYETWFKKTSRVDWQYLITNKTDFHNNFFRLGFNDKTGQIRFYTEHENEAKNAWITNEDYSDGEWHHVVATREGDLGKVYVDGVFIKEDVAMDGDIGGDNTSWFLAQDGNTNGYFIGAMDDVRIYNRALTEQEIQQNFKSEGGTAVHSRNKLSTTWGMIKEESAR